MNRTAYLSLALTATACTLVGAFFVQPPQAAARAPKHDITATPIAASGNLLCELTLADVAAIIDYYEFEPDMPLLADALTTPFDCSAYGELCSEFDESEAHEFVCGTWGDLERAAPKSEIIANIQERLVGAGMSECEPTPLNCQLACGMFNPVVECTGFRFNGHCYATPNCGQGPTRGIIFKPFNDILDPIEI